LFCVIFPSALICCSSVNGYRGSSTVWSYRLEAKTLGKDEISFNLSEAEALFLAAVHIAALAFEDESRLGHPAPERRCIICLVRVSQCCC
jgi:hypothetical protein